MTLLSVKPRTRNNRSVVNNNFDNFFNDFFNSNFPTTTNVKTNSPAINVVESEDGYRLEVAAPGFSKKDFSIEVEKEILTIAGKQEVQEAKEGEKYTRREFNYTEFKRTFHLPETIDAQAINATFENGILSITLNKKEEAKPQPARQIEIA